MSTGNFVSRYERLPQEWVKGSHFQRGVEVKATQSVNADRNRIFQALTLPEYIDAWFAAPGSVPGSTSVTMGPDCFLISFGRVEGGLERFVGSFKVLRKSKVQFSWKRDNFMEADLSLVKVRLQGDFGRTTVQLSHVGLERIEAQWYRDLWNASLERLARLF